MTALKGFGRTPGDSYDLSVEVAETANALAASVRSHEGPCASSCRSGCPKPSGRLSARFHVRLRPRLKWAEHRSHIAFTTIPPAGLCLECGIKLLPS